MLSLTSEVQETSRTTDRTRTVRHYQCLICYDNLKTERSIRTHMINKHGYEREWVDRRIKEERERYDRKHKQAE